MKEASQKAIKRLHDQRVGMMVMEVLRGVDPESAKGKEIISKIETLVKGNADLPQWERFIDDYGISQPKELAHAQTSIKHLTSIESAISQMVSEIGIHKRH